MTSKPESMWAKFKPHINLGNVIHLVVLLVTVIYAFAVIQKDVEANREAVMELQKNMSDFRQKVTETYVRKDVNQQILLRLEDIRQSQRRLEDKVDELQRNN